MIDTRVRNSTNFVVVASVMFKLHIYLLFLLLLQEISETLLPQWRKTKLRDELKTMKKSVDDLERADKANRMQRVCLLIILLTVGCMLQKQ